MIGFVKGLFQSPGVEINSKYCQFPLLLLAGENGAVTHFIRSSVEVWKCFDPVARNTVPKQAHLLSKRYFKLLLETLLSLREKKVVFLRFAYEELFKQLPEGGVVMFLSVLNQ